MQRSTRAWLAAIFSLGLMHAAAAADMPVKALPVKAPIAPPPYNWTGPYIGIAGGIAWGHSNQTDPGIAFGDGSYTVSGALAGGTLGYNWQQGSWVLGAEGDYSRANISGSSNACGLSFFMHSYGSKLQSLATLRARLGMALGPSGSWLAYATGGVAGGKLSAWDDLTPASGSAFRCGWTVGGGLEAALARDWTVKFEYLYVDLGKKGMFEIIPGTPETVSFTANVVRGGLNFRFMTY